jgi:hypothetical protein
MNGDKFHSELLALLKNAFEDIDRTKQRQWRDFYNVLIAIGAVTGLYRAVFSELSIQWMHHLFFISPSALMILGIWLVWKSQESLRQPRALAAKYYTQMDKNIQEIVNRESGEPLNHGLYPRLYTAVIAITAVFGTTIMIGLRFSQKC